jgi:hypothetical protein
MEEWKYIAPTFFTSALDGSEWWASRPGRFTPGERAPNIHVIGGWVDPRAGLDAMEKRNLAPAGIPTPAVQPLAGRSTDWPCRNELLYVRSVCYLFLSVIDNSVWSAYVT